jgi:alpha-mannosidase
MASIFFPIKLPKDMPSSPQLPTVPPTTSPRQKCYLICNAHLDPVWLWPWEEGLTEAISTYRVAADFCEQYPDFIFNHNESLLYEWVERNDPKLFRRIQRLVKKGSWHIAGGAYLQPDLIGASGESLIRHFLVGKTYFADKFGQEPTTAYNFDSFGHPQGFIQILAGCGFDSYVFCRPNRSVQTLPVGSFIWRHDSGAEIVARRSDDHYITQGGILKIMQSGKWGEFYKTEGDFMFLWGIGNHGGGPSHAEYADLKKLSALFPEIEFIESTPEAFFKHSMGVRGRANLSVVQGDLKPVSEGCYTSMQLVKARHRRLESMMQLTEKLAAVAWWQKKRDYPVADLSVAWKDILFSEFHDILPGSGIPKAEEDALNLLGHAEEILRRKRAEILISLLRDEPLAERDETPIFVFNPHSWTVTREVEIDFGIAQQFSPDGVIRRVFRDGKEIEAQFEKGEDNLLDGSWGEWRSRAVFVTTIPPLSFQRFDTSFEPLAQENIRRWRTPKLPEKDQLTVKTEHQKVVLNLQTGLLDRLEIEGRPVLAATSFQPLVFADLNHSWSTVLKWQKCEAKFELATPIQAKNIIGSDYTHRDFIEGKPPISILEDGPVRMIVQVILVHGDSFIVQRYVIQKKRPGLRIEQNIFWTKHDKKLCLEIVHDPALTRLEAEKCYSIDDDTAAALVGSEMDYQGFLRFSDPSSKAGAFAVVSHGTHGYSRRENRLRLNILRSPSYATHEQNVQPDTDRYLNRFIPRQDQGNRTAQFTFLFGESAATTDAVARGGLEANIPLDPFVYFPTNRTNKRAKRASFASVSVRNVLLTTLKKAETGSDLVFRLWEARGRKTKFNLIVEGRKFPLLIEPWQLKTFRLNRGGKLVETNLIEMPIKNKLRASGGLKASV